MTTDDSVDKAISGLRVELQTRFAAMDEATRLVREDYTRVPTQVDRAVTGIKELFSEQMKGDIALLNERVTSLSNITTQQFGSINNTFAEKDKAVLVGLSAQKESAAAAQASSDAAIAKMENNFTNLIKQGNDLLLEVRRNTELQLTDIKSRLDKGEGSHSGSSAVWGYVMGVIGLLLTTGSLAVVVVTLTRTHG